ncbi:hypothetical protein QUA81_13130 [Microcoleus sp. F6_B4]
MNIENFVHPLSIRETIDTEQGEKEALNSWAFASIIWAEVLKGNSKALNIAQELFTDGSQIPLFILRSKQGDETAVREAIAILALALEDKLTEAFENESNE